MPAFSFLLGTPWQAAVMVQITGCGAGADMEHSGTAAYDVGIFAFNPAPLLGCMGRQLRPAVQVSAPHTGVLVEF